MSALAKVFVVFVFILSVAFFGTSATLFKIRMDWKKAYLMLEADSKKALDELTKHNESLNKELDERIQTISLQKATQDQQSKEILKLTTDFNEQKGKAEMAQSAAKAADQLSQQAMKTLETEKLSNKSLQEQIDKVRADLDRAVGDAAEARKERDSIRLDLEKAQTDLRVARTEYKGLSEELDTKTLLVQVYETRYGAIAGTPRPVIDAMVNAVDTEEKLVVLSVGRDDKVEPGYDFTVYRGDQYIGKVQVIKVYPNLSGARITVLKEGAQIQRGDKASTRLGE